MNLKYSIIIILSRMFVIKLIRVLLGKLKTFTLLCAIHGATVENTLFEDGDSSNTFRAFNPTQSEETYVFLIPLFF